jgi:hypothetical protein
VQRESYPYLIRGALHRSAALQPATATDRSTPRSPPAPTRDAGKLRLEQIRVVGLRGELAPEERLAVVVAEDARAELLRLPNRITICLAVAVTFSRSFEAPVVTSAKISSSAARPPNVIAIVSAAPPSSSELVVGRQRDRVAARDHRNLVDRIGVLEVVRHERAWPIS